VVFVVTGRHDDSNPFAKCESLTLAIFNNNSFAFVDKPSLLPTFSLRFYLGQGVDYALSPAANTTISQPI